VGGNVYYLPPIRVKGLGQRNPKGATIRAIVSLHIQGYPLLFYNTPLFYCAVLPISRFKYHIAFCRSCTRLFLWSARVMYLITFPRL